MSKRALAVGGVVVVAAATAFLVPSLWGKPWSIDHFFARVFLEFALERPLVLSQLRILEPYGIDFHADDLDDLSVEFERDELAEAKRNLETLRSYDRDSLSESQQLSADVLGWFLEIQVAREPFLFYDYPVNQLNGVQLGLPDFMINVHQINDESDAENYRRRLGKFGAALDQVMAGLETRREMGVVPPRFVVERVRGDVADFTQTPAAEHFLVRHFENGLERLEDLDPERRQQLLDGVLEAVESTVYPAYGRLQRQLDQLAEVAPDAVGVWSLPDGEAYYAWLLRRYTTTELSADEIHRVGLAEVARIQDDLRAIFKNAGFVGYDLTAMLQIVRDAARFRYPDTDEGREAILADYQSIVDGAWTKLPELFGRLPKARVEVERVPEFMQAGAPLAYYNPPPFDGSKPGIFFANLRSVAENRKFRMRTLAHHEAVPGHHLQITLAMEMEGVPFFRRVLPFTAFGEGWALYAERLAGEHGLLPMPWDELGMLVDEMFRAVRLVVDTGIHAKRWTREQAIEYMEAQTGKPNSEVVAEIERYIVMPGQACAYKVGQLEILRLRENARERLADRFDLREFHDVVLGSGAVPLEILDRIVDAWVVAKSGSA